TSLPHKPLPTKPVAPGGLPVRQAGLEKFAEGKPTRPRPQLFVLTPSPYSGLSFVSQQVTTTENSGRYVDSLSLNSTRLGLVGGGSWRCHGTFVGHKRNLGEQGKTLDVDVEVLRAYGAKLIVFPREAGKPKNGDPTVRHPPFEIHTG
ncbi:hypothetical protein BDM02DRAFT_1744756, partial [Thelephora ganbajun]